MPRGRSTRLSFPKKWSESELRTDVDRSLADFVQSRTKEGNSEYQAEFRSAEAMVRELFKSTNNLLKPAAASFQRSADLVSAARFLGGPPVSADDLITLSGGARIGSNMSADLASKIESILKQAWDPFRFPWLTKRRSPTQSEIETAILWTSGVWAIEKMRTKRRLTGSRTQERAVDSILLKAQLQKVPTHTSAVTTIDAIERGTFVASEISVAGTKADRLARLPDGRLLTIECKVSNTAINSYKRLNNETVAKYEKWRRAFGEQVVTVAVLSGVFKLQNVLSAQEHGIFVIWQHNFEPLRDFVSSCR